MSPTVPQNSSGSALLTLFEVAVQQISAFSVWRHLTDPDEAPSSTALWGILSQILVTYVTRGAPSWANILWEIQCQHNTTSECSFAGTKNCSELLALVMLVSSQQLLSGYTYCCTVNRGSGDGVRFSFNCKQVEEKHVEKQQFLCKDWWIIQQKVEEFC